MMKTGTILLFLIALTAAQAQNIETKRIPGMTHYEHKFTRIHRIGEIGENKYPHISMYCKSNDSDMVMFRLKIEREGSVAVGSAQTVPSFDCDGDVWKGTNVTYESFPLSYGVIESFEFYAPMVLMEMLGNADAVVLDIEGAQYNYPVEMRKDFKDLYTIVTSRNKQERYKDIEQDNKPSFR